MLVNGCLDGKQIYSTVCDDRTAVYESVTRLIRSGRTSVLYLYCLLYTSKFLRASEKEACPLPRLPLPTRIWAVYWLLRKKSKNKSKNNTIS